jgi:HD-like signal output (HDOD) protein
MTAPAKLAHPPSAEELTAALRKALGSPGYRPPVLPSVALDVMSLAGQGNADLTEVVTLLERDPVLAGRVLALAQSAQYARRSPVVTIKQAAVRLGLEALVHLVLQAALDLQIFRAPGFEAFATRANRHATAVAHVTRDVCRRAGLSGEHAFIAGLLHDIGLSSSLLMITEVPAWRRLPFSALAPVLDAVHADASGFLARRWSLPEPLPTILAWHHHAVVDGQPQPINAALIVAEQLCWEAGAGIEDPPAGAGPAATETPAQPLEGVDVTWPTVVEEAVEIAGLNAKALCAARVQAFGVAASLGFGAAA